jgi:hypothetical protein
MEGQSSCSDIDRNFVSQIHKRPIAQSKRANEDFLSTEQLQVQQVDVDVDELYRQEHLQ